MISLQLLIDLLFHGYNEKKMSPASFIQRECSTR